MKTFKNSDYIKWYDEGNITMMELCHCITLTPENISELPADAIQHMIERAADLPANDDEEGWKKMRFFCLGSYIVRDPEKARLKREKEERESLLHLRNNMKVVREWLKSST